MHKRRISSGCGASRHFFDGPRPPGLPAHEFFRSGLPLITIPYSNIN